MSKNFGRNAALGVVSALAFSAAASAANIVGNVVASAEQLGNFTGTITYTPNTATTGTLNLFLTNTTTFAGGKLTGVVIINSATRPGISITLASTSNANFLDLAPTESASPFGTFNGGAALGADWTGGGSPNPGVSIGNSITLTFNVSGTGAGALTDTSFFGNVGGQEQLVVRFKGFDNGKSDKTPATTPNPGAASLIGLGGLMATRRKR